MAGAMERARAGVWRAACGALWMCAFVGPERARNTRPSPLVKRCVLSTAVVVVERKNRAQCTPECHLRPEPAHGVLRAEVLDGGSGICCKWQRRSGPRWW